MALLVTKRKGTPNCYQYSTKLNETLIFLVIFLPNILEAIGQVIHKVTCNTTVEANYPSWADLIFDWNKLHIHGSYSTVNIVLVVTMWPNGQGARLRICSFTWLLLKGCTIKTWRIIFSFFNILLKMYMQSDKT